MRTKSSIVNCSRVKTGVRPINPGIIPLLNIFPRWFLHVRVIFINRLLLTKSDGFFSPRRCSTLLQCTSKHHPRWRGCFLYLLESSLVADVSNLPWYGTLATVPWYLEACCTLRSEISRDMIRSLFLAILVTYPHRYATLNVHVPKSRLQGVWWWYFPHPHHNQPSAEPPHLRLAKAHSLPAGSGQVVLPELATSSRCAWLLQIHIFLILTRIVADASVVVVTATLGTLGTILTNYIAVQDMWRSSIMVLQTSSAKISSKQFLPNDFLSHPTHYYDKRRCRLAIIFAFLRLLPQNEIQPSYHYSYL